MNSKLVTMVTLVWSVLAGPYVHAGDEDGAFGRAASLHRAGDTGRALALWQDLAAHGNVDAAFNLGSVYYYADGVARDFGKAMQWYRIAADHGDGPAQIQLGFMYLNGEGVAADAAAADRWFNMRTREHAHHAQSPQMQAWRRQALLLIEARDRREAYAESRRHGDAVVAELQRRAASVAVPVGERAFVVAAESHSSGR